MSRALESIETKWSFPPWRARAGMNVITRESELQENAPFMSGVMLNAASAEARFIGSLNVTVIVGGRFVPPPRGEPMIAAGGVAAPGAARVVPRGRGPPAPRRARAAGGEPVPRP